MKIRTYGDKLAIVPEDSVERESFTVISIVS